MPSVAPKTRAFKATLLSWMAKYGCHKGNRQLLGYHLDPKEVSVMTYSRDCLAKPLRQLVDVLRDVRNAKFHPDLTRSGYKANPSGSASHEFVEEGCSSSREQSGGTSVVARQRRQGDNCDRW